MGSGRAVTYGRNNSRNYAGFASGTGVGRRSFRNTWTKPAAYVNARPDPIIMCDLSAKHDHFGFLVEDMDEIKRRLEMAEVPPPYEKPSDGRYAELGAVDVEGNRFDLSVAGWETERSRPDA